MDVSGRQAHRSAKSWETTGFLTSTHRLKTNGSQTTRDSDCFPLVATVVKAAYPPDESVSAPSVTGVRRSGRMKKPTTMKRSGVACGSFSTDTGMLARVRSGTRRRKSSRTRVVNRWQSSGLDRSTGRDRMRDARDMTKRSTGAVTTGGGDQKPLLTEWFVVLDERVTSRG